MPRSQKGGDRALDEGGERRERQLVEVDEPVDEADGRHEQHAHEPEDGDTGDQRLMYEVLSAGAIVARAPPAMMSAAKARPPVMSHGIAVSGWFGPRSKTVSAARPPSRDRFQMAFAMFRPGSAASRAAGEPRRHERDRRKARVRQPAVDRGVDECRVDDAALIELEGELEEAEREVDLELPDPQQDGEDPQAEVERQPQRRGCEEAGRRAVGCARDEQAPPLRRRVIGRSFFRFTLGFTVIGRVDPPGARSGRGRPPHCTERPRRIAPLAVKGRRHPPATLRG